MKLWRLHNENSGPYKPLVDVNLGGHRVSVMPATPSFPKSIEINQIVLQQYQDIGDLESVAEALGYSIDPKKSLAIYNRERGAHETAFSPGFQLSYRSKLIRAIRVAVETKYPTG